MHARYYSPALGGHGRNRAER